MKMRWLCPEDAGLAPPKSRALTTCGWLKNALSGFLAAVEPALVLRHEGRHGLALGRCESQSEHNRLVAVKP